MLAGAIHATTLPPAHVDAVASCIPTQVIENTDGPVSVDCHDVNVYPGGNTEYSADVEVFGLPFPGATVSATASSENPEYGHWLGYGQATLTGSIAIVETAVAPFAPELIPVIWHSTGSANLAGEETQAEGWSRISPASVNGYEVAFSGSTTAFADFYALDILPTLESVFSVYAFCGAGVAGEGYSACDASATGRLLFDQETFDMRFGDEAFALADYYRIEYSAGLTAVPLPPALMLFGLAMTSLVSLRNVRTVRIFRHPE